MTWKNRRYTKFTTGIAASIGLTHGVALVTTDALRAIQRGRVRIKMRTFVPLANLVDLPRWCALWRTPYEIGNNFIVERPFHMGKITFYA